MGRHGSQSVSVLLGSGGFHSQFKQVPLLLKMPGMWHWFDVVLEAVFSRHEGSKSQRADCVDTAALSWEVLGSGSGNLEDPLRTGAEVVASC